MSVEGWARTVLLEMLAKEYALDPDASRSEVAERVLDRLEGNEQHETLLSKVREIAPLDLLSSLAGEIVSNTRKGMRRDLLAGQQTHSGLSGRLPREAAERVVLTIPIGGNRTRKKRAILCTQEEVEAARNYYGAQKASIAQHEKWCGVIVEAFNEADLPIGATVADLYAA